MNNYALPIRFGVAASGCLIAYFLILSLLELHINVFYSLFNAVITGFTIYESIKYFKLKKGKDFTYCEGFVAGLVTRGVATLIFYFIFRTSFNRTTTWVFRSTFNEIGQYIP